MGHYRKIDTRIWNDQKFNDLSLNGKLAFLFVLTHPSLTAVGAMRGTIVGLAAELKVLPEAFDEAFEKGMLKVDEKNNLIAAKNFLKYNKPESPNVVLAWGKAYDMLPECELKAEIFKGVRCSLKGLGKGFQEAFRKGFGKEYSEEYAESVSSEQ